MSITAFPRSRALLLVVVVLAPLAALRGVFSTTEIFYLRDLSFYFWPEHLWLRAELLSGRFPLWDPYIGLGQPSAADPIRHQFFLPILLLRLLPETIGFNLAVALPFPVAAGGMAFFLRRHASPAGAALGALVFALSGPVLSTGNFPNLSWSVALLPWLLVVTESLAERPTGSRLASLACVGALMFTAGEAVLLLAGAALATAYAIAREGRGGARAAAVAGGWVAAAGVAGFGLAAPQALASAEAIARSARAGGADPGVTSLWSLHPLALVETVMPFFFGDYVRDGSASPWFVVLNDGLIPFLFSGYIGVAALALAAAGTVAGRWRWSTFWLAVLTAALVLALGRNTPVYPALQSLSPAMSSLRFPAKFLTIAALAISALAAAGWDALATGEGHRSRRLAATLSGALAAVGAAGLLASLGGSGTSAATSLATTLGAPAPAASAAYLAAALPAASVRLLVLAAAVGLLCWFGSADGPRQGLALVGLFAVALLDPLVSNAHLNPVMAASTLQEPSWARIARESGDGRVYVGGRLTTTKHRNDADTPRLERVLDPSVPQAAVTAADAVFLATFPSAWRVRDTVSFDLSSVWAREYTAFLHEMRVRSSGERAVCLRRLGARHMLLSKAPAPGVRAVAEFPGLAGVRLFEDTEALPRALVVQAARIEPDVERQIEALFDSSVDPRHEVVLGEQPDATGRTGDPGPPSAVVVLDAAEQVAIRATAPESGGYLVLADSFDPNWSVVVDGEPARMVRAYGLLRAVRLTPGKHEVLFTYEARALRVGLWIAAGSALLLGAVAFARRMPKAGR